MAPLRGCQEAYLSVFLGGRHLVFLLEPARSPLEHPGVLELSFAEATDPSNSKSGQLGWIGVLKSVPRTSSGPRPE